MYAHCHYTDALRFLMMFGCLQETTAGTLSSLVYYLAKYPENQGKARQEVLSVLGEDGEPDMDRIGQMKYLHACIQEAMRMNSPAIATFPRVATIPTKLGNYDIPPNTLMVLNIISVHHTEKTFHDHGKYNPDRFVKGTGPLAGFGLGFRQCPARNIAMWQLRAVAALVLREYEWSLPEDSIHHGSVQNAFSFTTNLNAPQNLYLDFRKRC